MRLAPKRATRGADGLWFAGEPDRGIGLKQAEIAAQSPLRNRLSPMRFVVAFVEVSLLADFVYEGARSIVGPYLASFGASATIVGFVAGSARPWPWWRGCPAVECRIAPGGIGFSPSPATRSRSWPCRCWPPRRRLASSDAGKGDFMSRPAVASCRVDQEVRPSRAISPRAFPVVSRSCVHSYAEARATRSP